MRWQVFACAAGSAGALFGGWLIGRWALGLTLIVLSSVGILWGVLADDGAGPERKPEPQALTVQDILDKARRAP